MFTTIARQRKNILLQNKPQKDRQRISTVYGHYRALLGENLEYSLKRFDEANAVIFAGIAYLPWIIVKPSGMYIVIT